MNYLYIYIILVVSTVNLFIATYALIRTLMFWRDFTKGRII